MWPMKVEHEVKLVRTETSTMRWRRVTRTRLFFSIGSKDNQQLASDIERLLQDHWPRHANAENGCVIIR